MDKEGYLTKYDYTELGELKSIQYEDGREVRLCYNPLRQLEQIEDWLGITRIKRDPLGRPIEVKDFEDRLITYTWGEAGERKSIAYPGGKKVNYDYDENLRLKQVKDEISQINYLYDEKSYLKEKIFSDGNRTRYKFNDAGQLQGLEHWLQGEKIESYNYCYDSRGNKSVIEKQRYGLDHENGRYEYEYDPLQRLEKVKKDGQLLRKYTYDGYGNRTTLIEGNKEINYVYNKGNQLISKYDNSQQEDQFTYDKRGNLTALWKKGKCLRQYYFGLNNKLEKVVNNESGLGADFTYNGIGNRVRRTEGTPVDLGHSMDLEYLEISTVKQTDDILDITKPYNNLLERRENDRITEFIWDWNILGMSKADGTYDYFEDDLGSPLRIFNINTKEQEVYGYDEFGNDLYNNQRGIQPFGHTGYQKDDIASTYYAQAREYRADEGRFISEDRIKGSIIYPYTLNLYSYCWGNPTTMVDRDGDFPVLAVLGVVALSTLIFTGCSSQQPSHDIEIPSATSGHQYKYTAEDFNSEEYEKRTNCYAYAFDLIKDPITNQNFKTREEMTPTRPFANQPGLLSGNLPSDSTFISGTEEGNKLLVDLVKADAKAIGLNFQEYETGMEGGYIVLLVVAPNSDYHWYREDGDGTWSHKPGSTPVITGVNDPVADAIGRGYTEIVGFYYINQAEGCP